MGGSQRDDGGMHEIFRDSSSELVKRHKATIQKFLDNGYRIVEEDSGIEDEEGVHGELVERLHTTILKPIDIHSPLPMFKFEAKETFGRYHWEEEVFDEWDEPQYQLMIYRKSADPRMQKEPWVAMDME